MATPIDPKRIPDMTIPDMTIPDRTDDLPTPIPRPEKVPPAEPAGALQKLAPWDAPLTQPTAEWKPGAMVWAPWEPTFAYPGTISEISQEGRQALIAYSDDGRGWVTLDQLQPLALRAGQKVQCRRQRGVFFFPVTILEVNGDDVRVRFEDNYEEEWSVVAALRMALDGTGAGAEMVDFGRGMASPKNLRAGARVWAPWEANVLYPATVDEMRGAQSHVTYDDGSRAWVMKDQLMPLDIPVGLQVLCRGNAGNDWRAGLVTEVDGAQVQIEYENGRLEWVKPAALALPTTPQGPAAQPTHTAGQWNMPTWLWWAIPAAVVLMALARCGGCSTHG